MTNHLDDEQVRAILAAEQPDLIGCTAITPSIYKAQRLLEIAKETDSSKPNLQRLDRRAATPVILWQGRAVQPHGVFVRLVV
jgi:hypothetical protein